MKTDLREEAAEYGRQARRALEAVGLDYLSARAGDGAAADDASSRDKELEQILADLGAWELRPREDADDLEAAAALCRSAGYHAVCYPVAERLARPADLDADGLVVVARPAPAAAVAGVDVRWVAVTLSGSRSTAVARSASEWSSGGLGLVADLDLDPVDDHGAQDVPLGLVLPCWTLLGMLDRAMDLTRAHVLVREQFGQALSAFQGVQFQLTEAEVERCGLEVLAKYALWSIQSGENDALGDALALRLAAVEAAEIVFRVAHQLHGASGFCDEVALSWLSRHSQPLRRLPLGLSATSDALTHHLGRQGLAGLYSATLGA